MSYRYKKGDAVIIPMLAQGKTQREAAAAGGVAEKTISRRMHDPDFRAEISRVRVLFLREAAGRLASSSGEAANILLKLAKDSSAPEHVQRSAASDILSYSMRLLEMAELDERLRALEEGMRNEA